MEHRQFTGINIALDHLHPHPDNPRKNLGDISELTESIRKNGIMQNLTVIPIKEDDDPNKWEYRILIGHRRAAAAKEANLLRVPCNVVFDMDPREQVAIMLEENMQR
ncbi:MAG: ParB N-terminal domain-containing protein, partial [Oscillospiraceae bacterium]|nr:ParB N-terminal domain-containing protein [Oscillospiraceae bacterium]